MTGFAPSDHRPKRGHGGIADLFAGRRVAWLGSFGALVLFPDLVFHLVLQILHVAIGGLELAIEHALQEALDVSRHTAQIITAWLGLAVLTGLAVWLYRKLRAALGACRARLIALVGSARLRAKPVPLPRSAH